MDISTVLHFVLFQFIVSLTELCHIHGNPVIMVKICVIIHNSSSTKTMLSWL